MAQPVAATFTKPDHFTRTCTLRRKHTRTNAHQVLLASQHHGGHRLRDGLRQAHYYESDFVVDVALFMRRLAEAQLLDPFTIKGEPLGP